MDLYTFFLFESLMDIIMSTLCLIMEKVFPKPTYFYVLLWKRLAACKSFRINHYLFTSIDCKYVQTNFVWMLLSLLKLNSYYFLCFGGYFSKNPALYANFMCVQSLNESCPALLVTHCYSVFVKIIFKFYRYQWTPYEAYRDVWTTRDVIFRLTWY